MGDYHVRVLQIEDNPGHALLVRRMLAADTDTIFELQDTRTLATGLQHLSEEDIDAVLLDLSLPDSRGLDTLRAVRAQAPEVPIIIVTVLDDQKTALEALQQGAQDYLVKGQIDEALLSRSIRYAIERQRMAHDLSLTRDRYRTLLDSVPDTIVIVGKDGRIISANAATERLTGHRPKEVQGKLFHKLGGIEQADFPDFMKHFQDVMLGQDVKDYVLRLKHKDGSQRWVSVTGTPIKSNDEVTGTLVIVHDVTESKKAEEALRESERQYRLLAENATDVIYTLDMNQQVTYVSPSVSRLLGYSTEEAFTKTMEDILTPDSYRTQIEEMKKSLETRNLIEPATLQLEAVHRDGSIRNVEVTARFLLDEEGTPSGVLGICRDITDRSKAEDALRESEERFRMLIENATDGISILDRDARIRYQSPSIERILGHKPEELIGKSLLEIIHPDDVPHLLRSFDKFPDSLETIQHAEIRLRHADGSWRWVEGIVKNALSDPKVDGIVCNFRDITERKQSEHQLRAAEEKYQTIFENSAVGITVTDQKERIVSWNKFTEDLLGMNSDDLYMRPVRSLYPKEEWKRIRSQHVKRKGAQHHLETKIIRKDQQVIDIDVSLSVLRDHEGNVTGSIGIIRDITKRKQAEEAMKGSELQLREKNAALRAARTQLSVLNKSLEERVATRTAEVEHLLKQKDEFVAQLGHDLKTPLTPLVGLLPLVKNREQDPQLKEMLGVAIDNVQYMRDLIVKTLELARLNTPGIEFALHKTNLLEQVMRVVDSRKMIIDEKDITVRSEIDEGIAVKADKLRLQEVIDNLIANAVKYTPSGGSVTLDAKRHDGVVTVSVSDTGIGMTQDQLELAFEPFYKADQSRHDLHSSGLGLSICKRIVEKHGGLIWAESPGEGKGSTLHFTIPQA